MIVHQAIWTEGRLHLWAVRCTPNVDFSPHVEPAVSPRRFAVAKLRVPKNVLPLDELRQSLGDSWDGLLVAGATPDELILRLPINDQDDVFWWDATSTCQPRDLPRFSESPAEDSPKGASRAISTEPMIRLREVPVLTLAFSPADAVDLLVSIPSFAKRDALPGASLRYWGRVAELVLELLAGQSYVPAVHQIGIDAYRGYWRIVIHDSSTSQRIAGLIDSMPPVCRAHSRVDEVVQASTLVESFLWMTVNALVRRCLEGDELAHGLREPPLPDWPLQMRWLKSLVSPLEENGELLGTPEQCRLIHGAVTTWLSKLEPAAPLSACRTCFRLSTPANMRNDEEQPSGASRSWRLALHVQSVHDPSVVLEAALLTTDERREPMVLPRPFYNALPGVRADALRAARHFPPLFPLAEPDGPTECELTLEEAYRFLRDVSPLLESEGFGVWLPGWWRDHRPRLRLRLDLSPADSNAVSSAGLSLDALVVTDWRMVVGEEGLTPEEITELARAKEPLVRLRGKWVEVRPTDVQAAVEFLRSHPSSNTTILDAMRQYYLIEESRTGLPVATLRAAGWVERLFGDDHVKEKLEPTPPPAEFHGTLRPYQLRGLAWLRFLARLGIGGCLADDMGLGKTIQMIALWLHEREQDPTPGPTLLVVPMSLVGNWQREIARFAPSLRVMVHHGLERLSGKEFIDEVARHDVVISTYGLTHRDFPHLAAVAWRRIALDEAQNIKNPAAKQSAAVRTLRAAHRVALTGTPVENRLSELWSIVDFLNPGYLSNAADFRKRFAIPIERGGDHDRAERLRSLIRPFVLRRKKDDPEILPDLPPKLEMKVYCNLTREQAALYEAVVRDKLGQIDLASGIQRRGLILATLVRLKQICNHPAHFLGDARPLPQRSGKCDRLCDMLEEIIAEGHRALVFTQFREMGELLRNLLREHLNRDAPFLHGGTPMKQRQDMIDRFQSPDDDVPVFLLSLKAGGLGLNLTAANHVFHFDRWWNPAVEDQATDRVHRIGQLQQVQVHKFVCIGTLEERIDALIERKRGLAERIVGSGEDWLTELSTEAIRELVTLSEEAVSED